MHPSIHLVIWLSIRPQIHLCIYTIHLYTDSPIHPSNHSPIHPSTCLITNSCSSSSSSLACPNAERCCFHDKEPKVSVPRPFRGYVGPGVEDMEGSLANVFPQLLARKAWGRCPAVSMREIYYVLAAWHLPDFLSGLSAIAESSPEVTHWAVGAMGFLVGGLYMPSHLSVVGYLHSAGFNKGGGATHQPPAPW